MFDTADFYSAGLSEEFLGKALGGRRKDVVVATKFGIVREATPVVPAVGVILGSGLGPAFGDDRAGEGDLCFEASWIAGSGREDDAVDVRDHDVSAVRREVTGVLRADAVARACHDGNATGELIHDDPSPGPGTAPCIDPSGTVQALSRAWSCATILTRDRCARIHLRRAGASVFLRDRAGIRADATELERGDASATVAREALEQFHEGVRG